MTSLPTQDDRNLLALVAVFAPSQAERLLSRLALPDAGSLRAEGARIAAAPRRARLLALTESMERAGAGRAQPAGGLAAAFRPSGRPANPTRLDPSMNPAPSRRHGA